MRINAVACFLALVVLAAACGPAAATSQPTAASTPAPVVTPTGGPTMPPAGPADLAGTQWRLLSLGASGSEQPVVQGSIVTLQFGADGQAGGSAGCNSYSAPYQVQDGALTFGEIVSTMMACADNQIMQQETTYLEALRSAGRFELAGDSLTIWTAGEQNALIFSRVGS